MLEKPVLALSTGSATSVRLTLGRWMWKHHKIILQLFVTDIMIVNWSVISGDDQFFHHNHVDMTFVCVCAKQTCFLTRGFAGQSTKVPHNNAGSLNISPLAENCSFLGLGSW